MKFLEMRCSEMVSEAILGQKQSCRSYIVRKVLHFLAVNIRLAISQLTLNFRENRTGTMIKGWLRGVVPRQ